MGFNNRFLIQYVGGSVTKVRADVSLTFVPSSLAVHNVNQSESKAQFAAAQRINNQLDADCGPRAVLNDSTSSPIDILNYAFFFLSEHHRRLLIIRGPSRGKSGFAVTPRVRVKPRSHVEACFGARDEPQVPRNCVNLSFTGDSPPFDTLRHIHA